jgi:hypothetical protein
MHQLEERGTGVVDAEAIKVNSDTEEVKKRQCFVQKLRSQHASSDRQGGQH